MLIKEKDCRQNDIQELNRLLTLNITAKRRFAIERELKCLASGDRNEQNSAYYLDFRFKNSPNWAVIHDLRIEHRGLVAQIDHLLINRFMDVYVLESKNYYYGVKITEEGEFLVWDGKGYQAIESPYEQNRRHIQALQMSIEDRNLAPRRLGFAIPVDYRNVILISPTSKLIKPQQSTFDLNTVIKADVLVSSVEKDMDKKSVAAAAKIIGSDTLREFCEKLVRLHRPAAIDYAAKFGVSEAATSPEPREIAPVAKPADPPAAPVASKPPQQAACRHCGSGKVSILYGKYGYYFKCGDCGGNTPVKVSCGKTGHNERIRKEGNRFFRECADCGSSSLYHVNL